MIIEEYLNYRTELLEQSKDDQGFIQQTLFLSNVLPSMLDAKLIDSEDFNSSYFFSAPEKMKINAYCVNESGERLQLFIVDENSIDISIDSNELQKSEKDYYDQQFKRATRFLEKALKGHLNEEIQDSHPARPLISMISSSEGADQFDVVEIFLISANATVSLRGQTPQPKRIEFDSENIKVTYSKNRERVSKELLVKKRLIDLNFLFNVLVSQGNREALQVNFEKMFGISIPAIKAADEEKFESYLCVLPANVLAGLYKEFSSRLLEKNVRSFLQFKGVNQGIRETIRKEPEKFVAYNNGVTITATGGEIFQKDNQNFIKSLIDFQIVNGGQTTATIYFTQKDGFDISKIKVMAKINVAKSSTEEDLEELISNISNFSNAQSRVSKVDLRSRNPQLVKLKSLSESVLSPSGQKWFFERSKGEFNTLVRVAGSNRARVLREYPNSKRFSKEQLAKYFTAWGEIPFTVKKGGEKVFRFFIEELSGEGKSKKGIEVNRLFYEELVAKIILFTELEKIYGQGKNSIGQIRSAAVPYALSIIYKNTDGSKSADNFDLIKIWTNEGLDIDLRQLFEELLLLINDLIKKYSKSDDLGEYSKKEELWKDISDSNEIKNFINKPFTLQVLKKYSISKKDYDKRYKQEIKSVDVDFDQLSNNVSIFSKTKDYYKKLKLEYSEKLSEKEQRKIDNIIISINDKKNISDELITFEKELISKIRFDSPEILDSLSELIFDNTYNEALDYIVKTFNYAKGNNSEIISEFEKIETLAKAKNIKFASIYSEIGKKLSKGECPNIQDLIYASEKFKVI